MTCFKINQTLVHWSGVNLYCVRTLSLWIPKTGNHDNWFTCS